MSGPVSPTMTQYKVARRSTGNQEQQMVNDKRSDEDEDEDEEEEEVEEEEDGTVPHDPVKKDFDEILDKIKKGELKSGKDERKKFFHRYEKHIYAQTVEEKTLLHELAYYERPFTSVKPLIVHLTRTDPKKYSELLLTTDDSAKNPLFVAIMKRNNKNNKLVELMCKNSDISLASFQKTLAMSCGERSENCLHAAIKYKLPFKMTIDLITRAAKNTFYAQDSNGFTPCHYAVEYERCTKPQIDIVKALIQYGDLALDQLSEKPCFFSVYQYHIHTRQGYLSGKKGQGLSPAQNPTDSVQLIRDYGQNVPHGSSAKPVKSPKESDLKRPPKDGHRGNFQGTKDDRNQMIHSSALSPIEDPREAHDETKSPLEAIIEPPATSSSGMSNPIVSNDNAKKKEKCNGEFEGLKEDAEEIRDLLQLHYLRTRTSEVAVSRLYGETSKEIFFEYDWGKIDARAFKDGFKHIDFSDVLQYVAFLNVQIQPQPSLSSSLGKSAEFTANGRTDMIFFFNWLREKGVKRILKVIVDDLEQPSHSDEAIENTLRGFEVEILDWRKIDLCPEVIYKSSKKLKEVYLRWSGNNAVLRAWSEPDGLKKLEELTKVHLHVKHDLETETRTTENIQTFDKRLQRTTLPTAEQEGKASQKNGTIKVICIENGARIRKTSPSHPSSLARENQQEATLRPHRWLQSIDKFVTVIQNLWPWVLERTDYNQNNTTEENNLRDPINVALIDDGVSIPNIELCDKILGGKSFDYVEIEKKRHIRPYYASERGHGTVMARMISRVCPMAKIYVIRLETHYDHQEQKVRITPNSAAEAIEAAVNQKVQIISMSWTIKQPENRDVKKRFDDAVRRAIDSGILLFCSAGDKGAHKDSDYPVASNPSKIFRIGAAKPNGNVWDWVGDINSLDFIIPGFEVFDREDPLHDVQAQTGSSVATALGAGLAALIFCCVQLAAMHTQMSQPPGTKVVTAVKREHLGELKNHEKMKAALENIGTSKESQNKFIEVWKAFDKDFQNSDKEKNWELVTGMARDLL